MMFRSLFFVAPLVSADEQTAMLQLNRRGEVHQTANDMVVGSLEKSLMSKEPEKMSETAVCTYYLKTVHANTLLQKISELKGEEKTHQLLQRAMDSVGAENLRSLEENLMSKDEDKKDEDKKEEIKKKTPCEVLTELRHAFKHHMNHFREVDQKSTETGKKIGELITEKTKEAAKNAAKIMEGAKGKTGADLKKVQDDAAAAFKTVAKIITDFKKEEEKKAVEALDEVMPKLKGSKMATTIKTAKGVLEKAIKDSEDTAIKTLDDTMKVTFFAGFPAPKETKAGKDVWTAGFTQTEADAAIKAVQDSLVKTEDERNKALETASEKILKPYVAHVFKGHSEKIWTAFANLWKAKDVLNTQATAFVMKTPPKCDGDSPKGCLDIGDDLYWQQASGYLEDAPNVEATCLTAAFKEKGHDFVPRKVCDGDHPSLECADEFLYLAKKAKKVAKDVCTNTVEKTDIPNDTKLTDKKFKDIAELKFMEDADTTTHACEKWEEIKDACKSIKA